MKGDVISDYFLMLWFQNDSQDTVGFRTFRSGVPKIKSWILVDQSDIWIPKCTEGGGNFPKFYQFLFWVASLIILATYYVSPPQV